MRINLGNTYHPNSDVVAVSIIFITGYKLFNKIESAGRLEKYSGLSATTNSKNSL